MWYIYVRKYVVLRGYAGQTGCVDTVGLPQGELAEVQGIADYENDNCCDSLSGAALRHQFFAVRSFGLFYSFSEY